MRRPVAVLGGHDPILFQVLEKAKPAVSTSCPEAAELALRVLRNQTNPPPPGEAPLENSTWALSLSASGLRGKAGLARGAGDRPSFRERLGAAAAVGEGLDPQPVFPLN